MEIVVTPEEMRRLDRFAMEELLVPGQILMENAGRSIVEAMRRNYGDLVGKKALIFCGKGNNGGDGFVVARHLFLRGAVVVVVLMGEKGELKDDAKSNFQLLGNMIKSFGATERLSLVALRLLSQLRMLPKADFIVDAIFGTGFSGSVPPLSRKAIEWINHSQAIKVAVDVPSGIDSRNGMVGNVAVEADLTITMGFKKTGLLIGKSKAYTGRLETADIGVFCRLPSEFKSNTFVVGAKDLKESLPARPFDAHKHTVGKVFVLAGSRGLTGAAAMASESALRAGAGAVVLGTPQSVASLLARKLTEVMVEPLDETSKGSLGIQAMRNAERHIQWADVVVIGPGISRDRQTKQFVWDILRDIDKPMLIDADALNAISEKKLVLKQRKSKNIIITPHTGELSRLIKKKSVEIDANRIDICREVAGEFELTLVLKGSPTVTGSPSGDVYVNPTGNPGMATAGSGDVLSGFIAGLWAQGIDQTVAAYCGVYLHGLAGDVAREKFGEKSLMALDIQRMLPEAIIRTEK